MGLILVTGATDGIGFQTALELSRIGHSIFVHGRTKAKSAEAIQDLKKKNPKAQLIEAYGDFSSFEEVHSLAQQVLNQDSPLDVLVNNAGVYMNQRELSEEGFELTLAVNYLAPFLLTHLLLEKLKESKFPRVVNVASIAHERGQIDFSNFNFEKKFNAYEAYASSKLQNILFSNELARRHQWLASNSLHPGVITTKLLKKGFSMKGDSVEKGCETSVFLADKVPQNVTGKYFVNQKEASSSDLSLNQKIAQQLWTLTEELVGI